MAILHHEGPYGTCFWEVICFKCNNLFLLENFGSDPDSIGQGCSPEKRLCLNCCNIDGKDRA